MKLYDRISSVLCDDVREEKGNKYSMMGIYQADIVFPRFPALLPKLCLCLMIQNVKTDLGECKITFKPPEMEPVHFSIQIKEPSVGTDITLFGTLIPFRAKSPGEARFEVRFGQRKKPSYIHKFQIKEASHSSGS